MALVEGDLVEGESTGDQNAFDQEEQEGSREGNDSSRGHDEARRRGKEARRSDHEDEVKSVWDPWAAQHKKRRLKGPSTAKFLQELQALVHNNRGGNLRNPSILALLRRNGLLSDDEDMETDNATESEGGAPEVMRSDVGDGTHGSDSELELSNRPQDEEQNRSADHVEEVLTTVRLPALVGLRIVDCV